MTNTLTEDVPGLYKLNILDIIDAWGGYPLQGACEPGVAQNAGVVELRCFINNNCPFMEVSPEHAVLVFNDVTLRNMFAVMPDSSRNILEAIPGTEGVFIKPRYVFRHNYIYKIRPEKVDQSHLI